MMGLLLESAIQLVGSAAGWDPCIGCCELLPFSLLFPILKLFSCSNPLNGMGEKRWKWASWVASHKSGEEECSLCTHFLPWGNDWTPQSFLALEEGWLFLSLSVLLILLFVFLLHWCAGTSQLYSQAFLKVFPFISHYENRFLWGYEVWIFLFHHLTEVLKR